MSLRMMGVSGVLLARDGEQNFVLGIILAAKAREVFVSFGVKPVNGFQNADGRSDVARRGDLAAEEPDGGAAASRSSSLGGSMNRS